MTRSLLVAAFLAAVPAAAQEPQGVSVSVLMAGAGTLSSDTDAKVVPFARIGVRGPLALGESAPLGTRIDLTLFALPGETVDLARVDTFRAVKVTAALERSIGRLTIGGQEIRTALFLDGGFATRLPGTPGPRDRTARHVGLGARLEERRSGAYLALGYGYTEEAGEDASMALLVSGQIPVAGTQGVLVIGGEAVLPLSRTPWNYFGYSGRVRDVVAIFVGVDAGRLFGRAP